MAAIRISAAVALLFVLLALVGFLIPLFYKLPVHAHLGADDVVFVIAYGSLFGGALLALLRGYSTILVAAWSWSLALRATLLSQRIAHPQNYGALLARLGDRGSMRNMLEHADQFELHIGIFYLVITLVALILVVVGDLNMRSSKHSA